MTDNAQPLKAGDRVRWIKAPDRNFTRSGKYAMGGQVGIVQQQCANMDLWVINFGDGGVVLGTADLELIDPQRCEECGGKGVEDNENE